MYIPTTYPGIPIGKAREIMQQTDKLIRTVPEVETVFGREELKLQPILHL